MKAQQKPIHLFWSPLSHRVYATRAWKEIRKADGGTYIEVTGQSFDVTDEIKTLIAKYGPDFKGDMNGTSDRTTGLAGSSPGAAAAERKPDHI